MQKTSALQVLNTGDQLVFEFQEGRVAAAWIDRLQGAQKVLIFAPGRCCFLALKKEERIAFHLGQVVAYRIQGWTFPLGYTIRGPGVESFALFDWVEWRRSIPSADSYQSIAPSEVRGSDCPGFMF